MQNQKKVQTCVAVVRNTLQQNALPRVGLVLGTGLGALAEAVEDPVKIPYSALPDFPLSTVPSHEGAFVAGRLCGVPVIVQRGRCHLYEGRGPEEVCMGTRVMAGLGIASLVITNSAGALNPQFEAGNLMLITDHINRTGRSPLTGPNVDSWGPRFPDMSEVYDPGLMAIAEKHALALGLRLERGVYVGLHGPELETRAETRALRIMGADAVGMSTVLEVIAARHMGLKVLGISCLSNKNLPDCMARVSIEDIIAVSEQAGAGLEKLLLAALPEIAEE